MNNNSIVVPTGRPWIELQKIYPLLETCKVILAGNEPPGFTINPEKTELVLRIPLPKIRGTATCLADGSVQFDFVFE